MLQVRFMFGDRWGPWVPLPASDAGGKLPNLRKALRGPGCSAFQLAPAPPQ